MIDYQDIAGKKVLLVGLGRTGVSLAHLLVKKGADVTVSDHKSKAELANHLEKMEDIEVIRTRVESLIIF